MILFAVKALQNSLTYYDLWKLA